MAAGQQVTTVPHLHTTLISVPLVSTATILPLRKPDSNVCAWRMRHASCDDDGNASQQEDTLAGVEPQTTGAATKPVTISSESEAV
jgi:phage-related protein